MKSLWGNFIEFTQVNKFSQSGGSRCFDFCDRIVLVLDGDEAGQRRTNEVLELFVAEKVDLRILTLPDDLDPCECLQERGAEAFADLLANRTVDALEHAFRTVTRGIDLVNDIHAGSQALERLVAIVAKAPRLRADTTREDRFREEKILQRLAASFRVPEKDVRDRLTALRREPQRRPSPASDPRWRSSRSTSPASARPRPGSTPSTTSPRRRPVPPPQPSTPPWPPVTTRAPSPACPWR